MKEFITYSKRFSLKLFLLSSIISSSFFASIAIAQSNNVDEKKTKILSAYLINFVKFIEFNNTSKEFDFCIAGEQKLADSVAFAAKRSLTDKVINSYVISSTDKIDKCEMVYISESSGFDFNSIAESNKNKFITVSDKKDFIKNNNGMIEIADDSGKFNFAINVGKIEKKGFKVSSKLVELAEEVY